MRKTIAVVAGIAAVTWLAFSGLGTASPRVAPGTDVFKGPMDPFGGIRFQALESKRGAVPRLDRFRLRFDCRDGLGPTGQTYGASPGSSIRPNSKGRFRVLAEYPELTFDLKGDFNRRYTKASGTFRFVGDIGDGVHTDCDTGRLSWQARLQP